MNVWKRIRAMSFRQLFRLGLLFFKTPGLAIPTLKASKETVEICNKHFGMSHHGNGIENAFRHALWNVIICEKTLKKLKNRQKSALWAEKVTNLYEKVTKNELLDKTMDLHNNALGRKLFLEAKTHDFEQILLKMMKNGRKIDENHSISLNTNELVYIS